MLAVRIKCVGTLRWHPIPGQFILPSPPSLPPLLPSFHPSFLFFLFINVLSNYYGQARDRKFLPSCSSRRGDNINPVGKNKKDNFR